MLSGRQKPDRKTGIDILGDVPWGTHLCLFYETEEDLIDILVPYFKAGLESNEFCMWVTSEPLNEKKAKDALKTAIPDFDRYLKAGQIEIISHNRWYLKDGVFELKRVLRGWIDKIAQAISAGFDGIRVTGNTGWLEAKDWKCLADYERQVDSVINEYQMLAICSYPLNKCGASEIVDVISSHGSALIRREGKWDLIESSERKKAVEALKASEKKYRTLSENLPQKIFLKDKDSVYMSCNENYARDLKIKAEDITGKTDYDFFPEELAQKYRADDREITKSGRTEEINEKYVRDGREVIVHTVKTPVRDKEGNVTGILGIFEDITAQRRAQKKLLDYQKRLRDLTSKMSLAEECERRRLAVGLHDQITQKLILFKIKLGSVREEKLPAQLDKLLDEIYEHLDQIIRDIRSLTFDLGSPTLYELGLEAAIREYLNEEIQQKHGLKTKYEGDTHPKPLDDDVCAVLYRSVRELLVNVIKHAQANQVKVSIRKDNDNICISVIDDGVGFRPPTEGFGTGKTAGFGLFSIRERLSYLGGSVEIGSQPGQGTHVTLVAPVIRKLN
jgi:PAS domain S-box-containing protein